MAGRRALRRRNRLGTRLLAAAAAVVVTVAVIVIGVRTTSPNRPAQQPTVRSGHPGRSGASPSSSPSATLDLSALPIAREPFCDRIDDHAVSVALGGPVTLRDRYASGDRAQLATGVRDVAHEYSCSFSTNSGAQARAWIFTAPVGAAQARRLILDARGRPGCSYPKSAPGYGDPTLTSQCRTSDPATEVVTLRGLFGDAWLSCQLTVPGAGQGQQAVARARRWCVHVATTLGART